MRRTTISKFVPRVHGQLERQHDLVEPHASQGPSQWERSAKEVSTTPATRIIAATTRPNCPPDARQMVWPSPADAHRPAVAANATLPVAPSPMHRPANADRRWPTRAAPIVRARSAMRPRVPNSSIAIAETTPPVALRSHAVVFDLIPSVSLLPATVDPHDVSARPPRTRPPHRGERATMASLDHTSLNPYHRYTGS